MVGGMRFRTHAETGIQLARSKCLQARAAVKPLSVTGESLDFHTIDMWAHAIRWHCVYQSAVELEPR
jgi:hypothetical protein